MKFQYLILFSFLLLMLSCKQYKGDFSKINIIGFENINSKEKVECKVDIINDKKNSNHIARVKFRGGSSIGYPKKNFTLNLEKDFKFKGLDKDDDWILNASVIDKTFLRNVLCYKLFREFDKKNSSPNTKYAEVFIDNKYYGFFVLTERLDVSSLKLDKEKSSIFKEPAVFRPIHNEIDSLDKSTRNYYHQKLPKDTLLKNDIDDLKNFILYASDSLFEAQIGQKISIRNIIDWHIMLKLSNNSDGLVKNFVLYRKKQEQKFHLAIWDCDHSFGRDGDNEINMLERNIDMKKNILLKRLMENSNLNYNEKVAIRWRELRELKKISKKSMRKFIKKESEKISSYVKRNFQKWPLNEWPYLDGNDSKQEIEIINNYLELRISQLDSLYSYD